jgi:hypothetical protein
MTKVDVAMAASLAESHAELERMNCSLLETEKYEVEVLGRAVQK